MSKKKPESNGGNLITNYFEPKDKMPKNTNGKKSHGRDDDFHESSRQAEDISSKTEVLHSDKEQFKEERPVEVSLQLIMIAPCDTTYFQGFKRRTKELLDKYSRENVLKFIMENAKFDSITNLRNLEKIDDDHFWSKTAPLLLETIIDQKKQKSISSNIRMLVPKKGQILQVTKAQIFLVIISMFFCIFPRQTNRKTHHYNLAQLMTISERDSESANSIKLQKLKCIINYLKIMSKRKYKDLEKVKIEIQRSVNEIQVAEFRDIEYKLKDVEFKVGLVEDRYKYDLMVDFANKNIGGGILNRGAVQQEILFSIFPELIFMVCVCYEMKDNQSLIFYGAERFNLYEGYSDSFKFVGTFEHLETEIGPFQSIIVAVDATDFKSSYREYNQYQPYLIETELKKFLGGIQASDYGSDEGMRVCTGKWGCGAFGGDYHLKFIIQWIACSIANKNMVFMCQNEDKKELETMANFLKKFDTLELLEIVQEYCHYGEHRNTMFSFLDFIKKYCC